MALKGDRFDAHAFLGEAKAKGAGAAVVRRGTPAVPGLALFEVDDTLRALGALAAFHRRRFAIPVAAVAGSNGKTTTKEMLAAILGTRGAALATEGNLNNEVGVPLTLLRLSGEHRAAVVELGMSAPGELARLTAMTRPDAGVVTLVAAEHLEFLKSLDGVAEAEGELYRGLLPGSVAVVNADDARCVAQAERVAAGVKKIFFGKSRSGGRSVFCRVDVSRSGGSEDLLGRGRVGRPFRGWAPRRTQPTAQQGQRHAGVRGGAQRHERGGGGGHGRGRSLIHSKKSPAVSLRPARICTARASLAGAGGVTILDDCYNASPASMEAALATLKSLVAAGGGKGRAVAVLGDMLELGSRRRGRASNAGKKGGGLGGRHRSLLRPSLLSYLQRILFSLSSSSSSAHFTEIEPLVAWLRPRLGRETSSS